MDPDWSPDGKRILYSGNRRGDFDMLAVPAEGGAPDTVAAGAANEFGRWSPDGWRVVYQRS